MSEQPQQQSQPSDPDMVAEMFAHYDSAQLAAALNSERDVMGSTQTETPYQRSEAEIEPARQGFKDALELLPADRRQAYDEATHQNPRVVELESPPDRFLLFTHYNFWEAAERLVDYWTHRRRVFGAKRFHLPMTLTGDGALTADEVEVVKRSGMVIAPKPDRNGRCVFVWDRTAMSSLAHCGDKGVPTRLKKNFYFLQILSESERAVTNGVVFIGFFEKELQKEPGKPSSTLFMPKPDGSVFRQILSEVVPVKPRSFHAMTFKSASLIQYAVTHLFAVCYEKADPANIRRRVHYCADETSQSICKEIGPYGLSLDHVPHQFGGHLVTGAEAPSNKDKTWVQQRQEIELERYSSHYRPTLSKTHDEVASTQRKRKMDDFDSECRTQQAERKIRRLQEENGKLKKQHVQLRAHLAMANSMLDCVNVVDERAGPDFTQPIQSDSSSTFVSTLKTEIGQLECDRQQLEKNHTFMNAAWLVATQFAESFAEDKTRRIGGLTHCISTIFKASIGSAALRFLVGPCHPSTVATKLFSALEWGGPDSYSYNGCSVNIKDTEDVKSILHSMGYILGVGSRSNPVSKNDSSFKASTPSAQRGAALGESQPGNNQERSDESNGRRQRETTVGLEQRKKSVQKRRKNNLKRL